MKRDLPSPESILSVVVAIDVFPASLPPSSRLPASSQTPVTRRTRLCLSSRLPAVLGGHGWDTCMHTSIRNNSI
ncbi:hypothetical protein E2C01_083654 [Portunus trituberculatus]|uniref:Uncharacterized protein n=1 Tax=Portunus trituberculatus TaxID=210409 RepID=A0A5B7J1U6_PORTR|nr:hypothetical protein [Portunus trituberculatus]